MSKPRTLETLIKEYTNLTDEMLDSIISNENVDVTTLAESEKFSTLIYTELCKALNTKERELLLDCNYPLSKMCHKTERQLAKGEEPMWLVNYYRLITRDDKMKTLIQIYVTCNPATGTCKFNLSTSCEKNNRAKFEAMEDDLHFTVKRQKDGTPRWSERKNVPYDDIVDVARAVCAILSATDKEKAKARAAKEKEKSKKVTVE